MNVAVIAALAGAILAPALGHLMDILFPARVEKRKARTNALSDRRGAVIEYLGVAFMLLGLALPFWLQGRVALAPTWHNTLALLASGLLAMILGIWAVTALSGDYRARGFLDYFARVRGVNPRAARMVAISAAAISVALLLALSVVP